MNFDMKELGAELVGTFMLVSSVCGAALFSAPNVGFIAVALSIGAAVLPMAYAVGPISGGHFNPARSHGAAIFGGAEAMQSLWLFWLAPIVGGIIGGLIGKAFYEE